MLQYYTAFEKKFRQADYGEHRQAIAAIVCVAF